MTPKKLLKSFHLKKSWNMLTCNPILMVIIDILLSLEKLKIRERNKNERLCIVWNRVKNLKKNFNYKNDDFLKVQTTRCEYLVTWIQKEGPIGLPTCLQNEFGLASLTRQCHLHSFQAKNLAHS
jgi:hypothetical protein